MASYSNAFVLSQWRYYGRHLGFWGNGKELVHGLYQQFTSEALKRGLIRCDAPSYRYVEVPDELLQGNK